MKSVYLAGPGVFRPDVAELRATLLACCDRHGLQGLWPGDGLHADAASIFAANVELLRRCDGVVADISPFRGPHLDPGTAWEIGWAVHAGKPVVAYTSDMRVLANRIPGGRTKGRDRNGNTVERFDLVDNLMICCSVDDLWPSAEFAIKAMARRLGLSDG